MKTLNNDECFEWLTSRKLDVEPYTSQKSHSRFQNQFKIPKSVRVSWIFRSIVENVQPFGEVLLHIKDWSPYYEDEMAVVSHIRQVYGEKRWLIETPGHVFAAGESEILIGLLSLITSYGWTASLHIDNGVTLLSWEGELLDLWSADNKLYNDVCELLRTMKIPVTTNKS